MLHIGWSLKNKHTIIYICSYSELKMIFIRFNLSLWKDKLTSKLDKGHPRHFRRKRDLLSAWGHIILVLGLVLTRQVGGAELKYLSPVEGKNWLIWTHNYLGVVYDWHHRFCKYIWVVISSLRTVKMDLLCVLLQCLCLICFRYTCQFFVSIIPEELDTEKDSIFVSNFHFYRLIP